MTSLHTRAGMRSRLLAVVTVPVLALASMAAASPSQAAAPDTGLGGTMSSLYQTNNTVDSVTVGGGVIYAGGLFTGVKAPGSTTTSARTYIAAFNASTGVATSFAPKLNGEVLQVALSPDGSTLYAAGRFTTSGTTTRNHFAAFSTSTGALTSWNPNATGGNGYSVYPTANGVYIGGLFTTVGGTAHKGLAKTSASTGALDATFKATADNYVKKMALSPDSSRLIIVGAFSSVGTGTEHGIASLDPATGADQAFAADGTLPNNAATDPTNPFDGCVASGEELIVSGNTAYVGGNGAQPGCFDGDFAIDVSPGSSGAVKWINPCEGATVALAVVNGTLYKGSHMHDCAYNTGGANGGFIGAFDQGNRSFYRLLAQDVSSGSFQHWAPNTGSGGTTHVGPLAMATDGSQLIVAGDFTQVNGTTQQGIARFTPKTTANNRTPQRPLVAPVATVTGVGKVQVNAPGTWDADNGVLTYTLFRGSTLVGTTTAESWPWSPPTLRFNVTVPSSTTAYTFTLKASDGTTTSTSSPASNSVTASAAPAAYATTVSGQGPNAWWRLAGSGADSTTNNNPGTLVGGTTTSSTGATAGDGSLTLDGSTGYVQSTSPETGTNAFTESVWFKTTTLTGGDLLGLASTSSGADPSPDRAVYLDNDGQVAFGLTTPPPGAGAPPGPAKSTVRSANEYNDGKWHQAVATYDGTTQSLYIDGSLAASVAATAANTAPTGYYRVGFLDLTSFNAVFGFNSTGKTAPNSFFLNGSVDEASFYNKALTASQVAAQFASTAGNNS